MKPTTFEGSNTEFAKDQDEYLTLPAWRSDGGDEVVTCWSLSWMERLQLLITGRLWLRQLVFGHPLQPQLPQVEKPLL